MLLEGCVTLHGGCGWITQLVKYVYKGATGVLFQSFLACACCDTYGIVSLSLLFSTTVTMMHEGSSTAPTSDQFTQLLEAIQAYQTCMDEKLEKF